MKSQPSPPPAPDYAAAATAQGAANLTAAQQSSVISNPNIVSPYGNQTVTWGSADPNNPGGAQQATVTQTLTPEAQAALTAQQQVQAQEAGLASQGINKASHVLGQGFQVNGPGIQTSLPGSGGLNYGPSAGQYGLANGQVDMSGVAAMPVNAGMTAQNAIMARLQPQIQQNDAALQQRLANQGLTQGSEAYNNAQRTEQQGNNDLYSQAALQGINVDMSANQQGYNQAANNTQLANAAIGQNFGQGATSAGLYNQAQNQQFNQGLASSQFANTAQQQSMAQQLGLYNQPLNQITALMSGSQIQNPTFQGYQGANVAAAPTFAGAQAQGQYNQGLYGQQMAGYNAQTAGLGALAGAAGTAAGGIWSDARLKSNIVKIGQHPLGIGVYEYDIFGQRQIGVMAQELIHVLPEAVTLEPNGYMSVNYEML